MSASKITLTFVSCLYLLVLPRWMHCSVNVVIMYFNRFKKTSINALKVCMGQLKIYVLHDLESMLLINPSGSCYYLFIRSLVSLLNVFFYYERRHALFVAAIL